MTEQVKDWLMRKFCLSPSKHFRSEMDHDLEWHKHEFYVTILSERIKQLEYMLENKEDKMLQLEVYDKETDTKHIVGTDIHDCLLVTNGVVEYYNLQNGDGTGEGYEFVEKGLDDEYD